MFLQILEILAPVLVIVGVGVVWGRSGTSYDVAFATRIAMNIGGPALVFITLVKIDLTSIHIGGLIGATMLAYALLAVAVASALWLARLPMRVFLGPLVFGNTGNLGLPLAFFAFGEQGLAVAVLIFAVSIVLTMSFGLWAASGNLSPSVIISQPFVYAAIFGLVAAYMGAETPIWIERTLSLAGHLLIPMMLITLGVAVSRLKAHDLPLALTLAAGKFFLAGLAALAAAEFFGVSGLARSVLLLQIMTPVSVTTYLFAAQYDSAPKEVATLVLTSTVLSMAAFPALLALLLS
jgi:predicted permease